MSKVGQVFLVESVSLVESAQMVSPVFQESLASRVHKARPVLWVSKVLLERRVLEVKLWWVYKSEKKIALFQV